MLDLKGLKKDDIIPLFLGYCNRKIYPAKHIILKEGEPSKDLYYIVSGSVTVSVEDCNGRTIILDYLNSGDFFGEIGLFNEVHYRSAFIKTRHKCEIAKINYEELKNLYSFLPDLLFYIAGQMAIRLNNTSHKVKEIVFTDVENRIANTLMNLCKAPDAMTHPDGMQIKITRKELGRIVCCSRETVGRVLKNMEEKKLISVSGKTIIVFDLC